MRCPKCSTTIVHHAKFCPKCGGTAAEVPGTGLPRAAGVHPSSAPIPRVGKVFIGALVVGLGLIVAGLAGGNIRLVMVGGIALGVVAVVAVIGHHVS